jgi:hypothetical protein
MVKKIRFTDSPPLPVIQQLALSSSFRKQFNHGRRSPMFNGPKGQKYFYRNVDLSVVTGYDSSKREKTTSHSNGIHLS